MINIRKASIDDSEVIFDCIKGLAKHVGQLDFVTATLDDIKNSIFAQDSHVSVFIAENDTNQICGFSLTFKTFSTFKAKTNIYIEDLFVYPEFRQQSVGTKLFKFICDYAATMGANKVEWYVNNANTEAIGFYNKIGAKILDYKSIYYIDLK